MNDIGASFVAVETAPTPHGIAEDARISVIMVVYMTGEALDQSLACVLDDPQVDEFIVVDNGSDPSESAVLDAFAERHAQMRLVRGQGNVGFARGANLGARAATGEVLIFLNPDAFLQPGGAHGLARAVMGAETMRLVGGRVLNADGSEQRGARRGEITPVAALLSLSGLTRRAPALRRFEVHWENETAPAALCPVPTISGAFFAMRRTDYARLGGFDEGYFLHVEDIDLCWRVREAGGEVMFHPKAEVIHLGHTSRASPLQVELYKGLGLARYFRKRARGAGEAAAAWLLWPLVVGAAVIRPLLWRLTGRAV
ncbi:MAG: glycosyltransferase family 2 protein [Phenylobacterium sp.]|uniref:glycosyltransferase family 2 protein n=1 Tax=Phenylobacterium sp. TaxID=1871053 RepID=UPI002724A5EF|nr:glycosyltransferase family 2 protein [Phenylobacterium sp.]MDO8900685.1 glycosyltransferase family 2 protein [Phenylobacterium sp.]MDP2215319.1 glycosyltransferase family 2 protein [Phenylobacterium sp.]